MKMRSFLDPGLAKELTEAKGDLAKHGVVIVRTIESDLEPAMMRAAKESLEAAPSKLDGMKDRDLDELLERLRKAAMKSSSDLSELYVQLLAKLGTEQITDLIKEIEGIGQLFRWERIQQAAEPLDDILERKGFGPLEMAGPDDVSESFKLELEERWALAFERFETVARRAADQLAKSDAAEALATRGRKLPRRR